MPRPKLLPRLLVVLAAGLGTSVAAQWNNPYTGRSFNNPAASLIDTMLVNSCHRKALEQSLAAPTPGTAATARPTTAFRPSGGRLMVEPFVEALGATPAMKGELRQSFLAVLQAFEEQAKASGAGDDVAAAIAFFIQVNYTVFHDGREPGDEASDALLAQCRQAFATPELAAASDGDKQKLFETLVMLGGLTAAAWQQTGGAERRHLSAAGGEALRTLLKAPPEQVSITRFGLSLSPSPLSTSPSPATSAPVAWVEQQREGATTYSDHDPATGRFCLVVVYDRRPTAGDLASSFAAEWTRALAGRFAPCAAPTPLLSKTSAGRRCLVGGAELPNDDGGTVFLRLHVLDLGAGKVQSVLATSASEASLASYARDVRSLVDRTGERGGRPRQLTGPAGTGARSSVGRPAASRP